MMKEIRLPAPHPRFRPRVEEGLRRPGHPGTAVRIGKDLFEVVAAERSGGEWVYRLEPWTGQDTIRVYIEWNEEAEREFAAGLREDRKREQKDFLTWGAQAFLGFLPAKNQERLYQERGLDPARATLWSAALETLVASPFALLFLINTVAGRMGGLGVSIPAWAGVLALVAMIDGVIRLVVVISTGDPIGSLFLALLGLRLKSAGPRLDAGDEILAGGELLNVVSSVPKVWWERAGGVTYGGESFILTGSGRDRARFVYHFRKGGEGFPVLDPALEKVRNRSSDLSYVFAPLWGFLPHDLQRGLEFYGRYKPRPYVIMSICFNVLLAIALIGPGLRDVSLGVFKIGSLVLLAAAIVLLLESIVRLIRLMTDGQATGSFLGFLLKPVYGLAIKDKPIPPPS
jgi:hypothetical protein